MRTTLIGTVCLLVLAVIGGCRTVDNSSSPVEIRAADKREHSDWTKLHFHVGGLATWVAPDATVVRDDIVSAKRSVDDFGQPIVILQFDQDASKKMDELSTRRMSQPVAILVDGEIIAAPILLKPVSETLVVNFGKSSDAQSSADRLADAVGDRTKDKTKDKKDSSADSTGDTDS
jgi:preprotein translocase subunit SecD